MQAAATLLQASKENTAVCCAILFAAQTAGCDGRTGYRLVMVISAVSTREVDKPGSSVGVVSSCLWSHPLDSSDQDLVSTGLHDNVIWTIPWRA